MFPVFKTKSRIETGDLLRLKVKGEVITTLLQIALQITIPISFTTTIFVAHSKYFILAFWDLISIYNGFRSRVNPPV